jgi:DNA modification methylase
MKSYKLLLGNTLDKLKELPDQSVHCVVTSPPYWQLRDYFIDRQIGLETNCQDYIDNLVSVFDEVYRVLRDDGVLWVVIGDTYSTPKKGNDQANVNSKERRKHLHKQKIDKKAPFGLKKKNLIGIPWRLAFTMQERGWYWRCDVTWHKNNPTPAGVFDRPTRATEAVLMFSKKEKYFYDYYAIMDDSVTRKKTARKFGANNQKGTFRNDQERQWVDNGKRNKRSVWSVPVASYKDQEKKHFAIFPPKLIEPCILSSTSEHGCCIKCKSPWKRIIKKEHEIYDNQEGHILNLVSKGWKPSCKCNTKKVEECVVLDPFCGTSTTGYVSLIKNRSYIGIDINPEYIEISETRLSDIDPIEFGKS